MKKNHKEKKYQPEISNYPEELNILDLHYWENKAKIGYPIQFYLKKKLIRPNIFEFAPESIKLNKEINLIALEQNESIYNIHSELINDRNFIMELIKRKKGSLSFLSFPNQFKCDEEISKIVCIQDAWNFKWIDSSLQKNREFVLEMVSKNGYILEFVSIFFKKDIDIVQAGISHTPKAIHFLKKSFAQKILNKEDVVQNFINEYCKNNGWICDIIPYISKKLRNNVSFMLPYIEQYPTIVRLCGQKIRDNEDIMLKANSHKTSIFASDRLKNNKDFMLKIIKNEPESIKWIGQSLQTISFYKEAINCNVKVYDFLHYELKENPSILCSLFEQPHTFVMLSNTLRENICNLLYENNPELKDLRKIYLDDDIQIFAKNYFLKFILESSLEKNINVKKLKI